MPVCFPRLFVEGTTSRLVDQPELGSTPSCSVFATFFVVKRADDTQVSLPLLHGFRLSEPLQRLQPESTWSYFFTRLANTFFSAFM